MQNEIQNNKLQIIGKLSASLVHEIRNPLSAIRLNLEYMKMMEESLHPEVKDSIDSCLQAVDRIHTMVESMLEFSRKPVSGSTKHSLNDIIDSGFEILRPIAELKGVKVEKVTKPDITPVHCVRNQILQIIINLMTNAIEACSKGDVIYIKTYQSKAENGLIVTMEIQDTGEGIPEEAQRNLFTEFYTNKESGTGLGLTVCKKIADDHGAKISFRSIPGEGTTFYVNFTVNQENNQ